MRFCQSDGTPLVDDAPAFDPDATVVARPEPPAAEMPQEERVAVGIAPIAEPEEVLDLPAADPLKTMYVSEDEMRAARGRQILALDVIVEDHRLTGCRMLVGDVIGPEEIIGMGLCGSNANGEFQTLDIGLETLDSYSNAASSLRSPP